MSLSSPIGIGLIVAVVIAIIFVLFLIALNSKKRLSNKQKKNTNKRTKYKGIS